VIVADWLGTEGVAVAVPVAVAVGVGGAGVEGLLLVPQEMKKNALPRMRATKTESTLTMEYPFVGIGAPGL
jgi:hypothetical protein